MEKTRRQQEAEAGRMFEEVERREKERREQEDRDPARRRRRLEKELTTLQIDSSHLQEQIEEAKREELAFLSKEEVFHENDIVRSEEDRGTPPRADSGVDSDPLEMIRDELYRGLPLVKTKLAECKHDQPCRTCRTIHLRTIVPEYNRSIAAVRQSHADFEAMLKAAGKAAVWPAEGSKHLYYQHAEAVMESIAMPDLEIGNTLLD